MANNLRPPSPSPGSSPARPSWQPYATLYGHLLQFYPAAFRRRFGSQMAQNFIDLCQERTAQGHSCALLAFWLFLETLGGIMQEQKTNLANRLSGSSPLSGNSPLSGPPWRKMILQSALAALLLWMAPLIGSLVVPGWNWPVAAFVVVYGLFFGLCLAFALIARKSPLWSYKLAVGLSLLAGFALGWSNMVHIADSENPANFAYFAVLVVGIAGAFLARLRPTGLSRTLFAMATLLAVIALLLPPGAPPEMARDMHIGHALLFVLFAASGCLFRHASFAHPA